MNRLALILSSSLLTTACSTVGNLTSIYRTPDLERGESVVLDAEQWAILNIPRTEPHPDALPKPPGADDDRHDDNEENGRTRNVVCAMPSPDAIAAAAAAGNISLNNPGGTSGAASLGLSEAASSIGLRTQSIQLLRDAMYRMCEGYAAGAVDEVEYGAMMRRFQANMIAILAIEQLTGAVQAPTAAVSASAQASVLGQLMQERDRVSEELRVIETQLAIARDNPGYIGEPERSRLTRLKAQRERDLGYYETALAGAARGDRGAVSASVGAVSGARDPQALAAVAHSVEAITLAAMSSDLRPDMCFQTARRENATVDITRRRSAEGGETVDAESAPKPRGSHQEICEGTAEIYLNREASTADLIYDVVSNLINDDDGATDAELPTIRALLSQLDPTWTSSDLREFSPRQPPNAQ